MRLIGLDPAEYAPLLAPLVDIPLPDDRARETSRRRNCAAGNWRRLTAWVLAGARSQPVVLAFEDLHWADPTSLDLMRALAERGAQAPLLIVATTRPEFRPPWSVRSHHSVISLAPLDRAQVAQMVGELAARHALSKDVIEGVSERTGGVPLFVEEVTRLLLGARRRRAARRRSRRPCSSRSPRGSTGSAPRARSRRSARCSGATSRTRCSAPSPASTRPALQSALERLAEADLLFVEGAGPQANYRFKHALIQDAAYESLLKSRRQALHRRAAEVAARSATRRARGDRPSFHPGRPRRSRDRMVGQGGRPGAAPLGLPGGDRPSRQGDRDGGQGGRDGAAGDSGSAAPSQRLTQLHVAYGNALIAARGYGAPETTEAFARARESASGDKDAPERLAADYGLWVGSYVRGELPSMRAHAAAFLSDVEARPDSPEAGVAHRAAGITCWFAGEYREARDHLERALALFQPGRDDDLAFRFGHGPRRRRDGLSGDCVVASRRSRSRDFAHRPHADADRGPHPCRHARVGKNARGHVRIDAWRPRARRAERLRTRPPRARA